MGLNVTGGALNFEAILTDEQFEAGLARIESQLKSLTKTANDEASAIENIASKASLAIGSYLSLSAAKNFISEIANVRGQYEQLSVSFRTMLGNKEKADALMAQAIQLASTTPFSLLDVAAGAKQLLAYGTAAEKIPDTLKTLGNVAAGVSAPLGDIVYLYGTLQTQGRAYTRDILQFTSRGIPIIAELAKQFNVSTGEVQQLVEAGKVGFPEVQKAFQSMTGAGGIFFNLMEEQSKTVTGQLSNLGDSFNNLLNEIGQSNEGIIVGSIAGLKSLIDNYQTVIDIIKVLVITYGAYKAAVIATTAYNAIAAETVAGYTLAEQLRYRAMVLSETAMNLLNKTMLANPYVAVAAGITALVSAYIIFKDETIKVKSAQELLADAQQDVGDRLAETEAKIRPYLEALKNANITEQERVDIYNKLKAIDPDIIKGLDAKTLSYQSLANNVNNYLDALRKQISLESSSKAIAASIKQENEIKAQINDVNNKPLLNKALRENSLKELTGLLEDQQKVTKSLGETQFDLSKSSDVATAAQKRTVDVIDSQISELKKQQTAVSSTSAEYKKFAEQIAALQKEREGITGKSEKQLKAEESGENKINAILNERENILTRLAGLQRDSKQSGLLQNQSEIDKIKEKYEQAFDAVDDYNKKVAEFNKKNKTSVKGIGLDDVNNLRAAEQAEINNTSYKQDSAAYIASLDDKKKAFEDFERIQQQGNENQIEFAKQSYKEQLGSFTSFLDFLKNQADDLKFKISVEPDNIGYQNSLLAVNKAINEQGNKQQADIIKQRIADYAQALQAAVTFNDKKKEIDDRYNKQALAIGSNANDKEVTNHLNALKQAHEDELKDLQNNLLRQSDLYRQLNEDIISFTRAQLKERIDLLKQELKQGFTIDLKTGDKTVFTPQMKADLQSGLESAQGLYVATDKTVENFDRISSKASEGESAFRNLGTAVSGINKGLSDTLNLVADIIGGLGKASQSFSDLKKAQDEGDKVGEIAAGIGIAGAVIGTVSSVLNFFKAAKQSRQQAQAELKAYQDTLLGSEVAYNELLRDRARTLTDISDLTVQELHTRQELLKVQQQQAQADFNRLLAQIQSEGNQVTGESIEKTGGFLGIGRKSKTVQDLAGLSDVDYDNLEKLFTEGKLDEGTAKWFQDLQKVNDELDTIGESATDVADQLNQALTGTTADSITDDIVQGFANGKRAASDFADDFQSLMQNAILQSLKYNALQKPLEDFYNQFAADVDGDNALTDSEITNLQNVYNGIIDNASKQFEDLQNITKVSFDSSTSDSNSLTGAIKGMTEQTADLLAGQLGGVRLNTAGLMQIAQQQLNQMILIANYAADIPNMKEILSDLQLRGIKIRP